MEKMKNKLLFVLAIVFLAIIPLLTLASANDKPNVVDMKVYVKGVAAYSGYCIKQVANSTFSLSTTDTLDNWQCYDNTYNMPSLELGENIDVKVVFTGGTPFDNARVRVWTRASGSTIEDETGTFDVYEGNTYTRTLNLRMPSTIGGNTASPKVYTMHVAIEADNTVTGISEASFTYDVQRLSNELQIKSLNVRSACTTSCNTVYADVVVKNTGNHDLEDVYVKATIKELGVSGISYIDLLVPYRNSSNHDEDTSREVSIALNLPANVKSGAYTLEVKAYNDDTDTVMTQQFTILGGSESPNIDVVAQTSRQDVEKGKSTVYTLLVTNRGTTTQTFTVESTGTEGWATSQINPASFSLAAGESKIVSVYVATNEDAVVAEHIFNVKVRYGQEMKTFNFVANLTEGKTSVDVKTALMIVGIVLAVAIVILLIVLLTQRRVETEKPEESYY